MWGPGYETETEYTRVYVRRLRAKLEDPDGPPLIATEPRAGYRMALPDRLSSARPGLFTVRSRMRPEHLRLVHAGSLYVSLDIEPGQVR